MTRDEFLALRHWPALLSFEEVAWVLGIEPWYVAVIASAGILKPAGKPVYNGRKFFIREKVLELAKDESKLNRIAIAMVNYNASRNHGRTSPATAESKELAAA